ncbi:DNA polymerase-3 subunit delta' [Sphaerotilus hippei]|uniref:DNA polymerase-3 subunit delta n=1 Tax=Sphaerotilus hippei TaxID=744406 RepID=A0A318HE85_9BURK|nr:DNA polymerase III subunit delta' [Sphaerotilus hippei]PXW98023.1 DNA polymerase-3 subunit delta' [Sphaerotilus hippei]
MVSAVRAVRAPSLPPTRHGLLPWLRPELSRALRDQQGHALLVHGPEGVGQMEFALALAQAWLCETDAAARPDGLACGRCPSCHLVDERSHPDLRLIVPDALKAEAGLSADDGSDDEGRKRKPSREIRVEQIRAALEFSALTAGRSRHKVMVLHPAEALNAVAANALLKTLEEPPGGLRFVLSCGAPEALLPTIRSRCQDLRLRVPEREVALAWLQDQGLEQAAVLLDASGLQPLQALALARQGLGADVWLGFPAAARAGVLEATTSWTVPLLIDALHKLCHDSLMVTLGQSPRFFAHGAPVPAGSVGRLTAWSARLRDRARQAEHPWSAGLAFEALMIEARQQLGGVPARGGGQAGPRPGR